MAKNQTADIGAEQIAGFALSLDEYCTQLSQTDTRVEMIGGFYNTEKKSGHTKDTAEAFAQRFAAFAAMPV